jgi:tetratricopeptide (TPR) repeat protein
MTGEHAERAGETALAIDCFDQAGREAERRFANAAAQSWTRRAVVLLGESEPHRRFDLLSRLQKVADTLGDRPGQDALHAELAAVLEHHPDDGRLAELSFSLAMLAERRDDGATSERLSREAYVVAERCGAAQWAAMSQANLAWLHFVRQDYEGARQHVDISLQWPDRIENEARRNETRAQLLTVSAMVSTALCRFTEALETLQAVLSLGQRTGLVRLQLGALSGLASAAAALGRWSEVTRWGQEARALADSIGAAASMATAGCHLGQAAMSLNDHAAAIECHQGLLTSMEAHASSHVRAAVLQRIGVSHLELGDAAASLPWLVQAQAVYDSLDEPIEVCLTSAYTALAEARLGQPQAALSKVDRLMDLLDTDMAARPAHQTIEIRWICRRVLADLLDARAEPMLERLFSDVQIRAAEVVDAPDRERLIQALPVFRGIVAAHRERA